MKYHRYFPKLFSYREMVSRSVSWGHYFLLLNALLAVVLGLAYVYGSPHTSSFVSFVYLIVTDLGHMAFLAFLLFLIVMFPLAFAGNYHYYRVISVVLVTMFHTAVLIDIKLYLYVKVHLSCSVMRLVLGDMDFNTGLNYNFLWIALPLITVTELLFARLATRSLYKLYTRRFTFLTAGTLLICFVASHCLHIWADATGYDEITTLRTSYPVHYPMTARTFLRSHGLIAEGQGRKEDTESIVYPLTRIRFAEQQAPLSTVVIFAENLSLRDLSAANTPGLMAFSGQAENFTNYFLPYAPSAHNVFAVSYGIPLHYQASVRYLNLEPVVVYALNHREFMQRLLLSNAPLDLTAVSGVTGLSSMQIERYNTDQELTSAFTATLAGLEPRRPFALTVSLAQLRERAGDDYTRGLRETDRRITAMLNALQEAGLFESSLIIISSLSGHHRDSDPGTVIFNRDQQRVPLLIKWPHGYHAGHDNPALASAFDLSPTLGANAAGISNDCTHYSMGANLRHVQERDFIPVEQDDLLLIGREYTTVHTKKGRAFVEDHNRITHLQPNLENLIRAMRDLNRFKE